jgi:hypothetical protein
MRADNLPVVTRAELDAISRKVNRLGEKMALATQLGGERGHAPALVGDLELREASVRRVAERLCARMRVPMDSILVDLPRLRP